MQPLYHDSYSLDERAKVDFYLSEDILMENAASAVKNFIYHNFVSNSKVLLLCGQGNNGADGLAIARMLSGSYNVSIYQYMPAKTNMAKLQYKRLTNINIKELREDNLTQNIAKSDVIVDAIFGIGFIGNLPDKIIKLNNLVNASQSYKIACDLPSGINKKYFLTKEKEVIKANTTITFGCHKLCLYQDCTKDLVGHVIKADLGLSSKIFQLPSSYQLLEQKDLCLPHRKKQNTNKGSFGQLMIVAGAVKGAAELAGLAASNFGVGKVAILNFIANQQETTIKSNKDNFCYNNSQFVNLQAPASANTINAIVVGMGLIGNGVKHKIDIQLLNLLKQKYINIPKILDADIFYFNNLQDYLNLNNLVLTPHPKEFCQLLRILQLYDISVTELQQKRMYYVESFANRYPNVVLLLKGATPIISYQNKYYLNPLGTSSLSKGGSGDVLAGMIGALVAQGLYSEQSNKQYAGSDNMNHDAHRINSTIQASLAHAIAGNNYEGNDYSMTPIDLIEQVKHLK